MLEKNDLFEELTLEMSKYLAKAPCGNGCLSLNGCFWSIGQLKKNHDNLKVRGDFSSVSSEICHFKHRKRVESTEYNIPPELDEDYTKTKQITEDSKSWKLPVKECVLKERRWLFFLNREIAFKTTVSAVACKEVEYGTSSCGLRVVSVTSDTVPDALDLSQLRLILTRQLLIKILLKQGFSVLSESETKEDCVRLHLTLNPALKIPDSITIVVGVVKNIHTSKKESEIDPEQYQRLREKDMEEASIHKYGSNVREDSWKSFISSLASSSMKLDFLQSKISHPVSLDMSEGVVPNREKSYKGPQFLLYNYARLVSVLRSFDKKVNEGVYPPLVSLEDVDFSLLSEEVGTENTSPSTDVCQNIFNVGYQTNHAEYFPTLQHCPRLSNVTIMV
ncbi:hypothetical protein J437_LFUL002166 [Ladona fulva]|uniref:Uncharacterized protein n=1 Tax=Ladona fulva TaxID=123851 RepID=A0A8K0JZ11_LADFU|nr:hypothetical protein J437_LFUL002166 [Ladona fulva]